MLSKLLRLGEGRMVKRLRGVANYVNSLSDDVEKLTDAELRAKTDEFRKRVADGEALDDLLRGAGCEEKADGECGKTHGGIVAAGLDAHKRSGRQFACADASATPSAFAALMSDESKLARHAFVRIASSR